jgi:hypothetical protein
MTQPSREELLSLAARLASDEIWRDKVPIRMLTVNERDQIVTALRSSAQAPPSALSPELSDLILVAEDHRYSSEALGISVRNNLSYFKGLLAALHAAPSNSLARVLVTWQRKVADLEAMKARGDLTPDWGECSLTSARTIVADLIAATTVSSTNSAIEPHAYSPDYQAMGDCRVCGHQQDRPWHATHQRLPADWEQDKAETSRLPRKRQDEVERRDEIGQTENEVFGAISTHQREGGE